MTFNTSELSVFGAAPVEFYEFQRGTQFYRYTTNTTTHTYNLQEYTPTKIRRTKIEQGAELNKQPIKITVPWDNEVAAIYMVQPPGVVVTVIIRRYHKGDGDTKTIYKGRITSVLQKGSVAEITCESNYSALKRSGLRRNYQTLCPHVLYSQVCGVEREPFKFVSTADAIIGSVITVPGADAYDDGYFMGGYLQYNGAVLEYDARIILDHSGTTITLASPLLVLPVGGAVWLFPGCNHTIAQCDSRFANSENHGGFPFRPDKNPFNTVIF